MIILNIILAALTLALLFLAIVTYATERHRDRLSIELATKQAGDKRISDCAEQARRTAEDFGKHPSAFGPPPTIIGESNHYNHKLSKCIVDVETAGKQSTSEFVLDAYEQSSIMLCVTTFTPKAKSPVQRTCLDSQNKRIDPAEADKHIDALMRE